MAENKPIAWYTKNGKHIPIFDVKVPSYNEYQKNRQITNAKKQADSRNGKQVGLPISMVTFRDVIDENSGDQIRRPDERDGRYLREISDKRNSYVNTLLNAGAFDDDVRFSDEDLNNYKENGYSYSYRPILDSFGNLIDPDTYLESGSSNTVISGLAKWVYGANKNGYGKDRQKFDEKYGISDFIDKHESVQLNTDLPLYRGVKSSERGLQAIRKAFENGDDISMNGASSWTSAKRIADLFTKYSLVEPKGGYKKVMFIDTTKGLRKAMPYPFSEQAEVISSGSARYKVLNIDESGDTIYVTVKQGN